MLSNLYKIYILLTFILPFLVLPKPAIAQSCGSGSTSFVQGCDSNCDPIVGTMNYTCFGSSCTGFVSDNYCSTSPTCHLVQGTFISIPCGGAVPGDCPSECKRNDGDGCGAGFSPGTGCGTCPLDQFGVRKICCKPNNCTPVCTNTAPSAPLLSSPSNGSTLPNVATTNLIWNAVSSWGNSCSGNVLAYDVFVGTDINNLGLYTSVGAGTTSVSYTGSWGNTYYWRVRAKNGALQTDSAVWSFSIPACGGVTAPVALTPTATINGSAVDATLRWTPGTGGVTQKIRFDQSEAAVENGTCSAPWCVDILTGRATFDVTGLEFNKTYFWRVVEYQSTTAWKDFGNQCLVSSSGSVAFTTPLPPNGAWWQVQDGDITAVTGSISSDVYINDFLDADGVGGFPGVPVYSGSLATYNGGLSSKSWEANTTIIESRIFNYSFFENLIPSGFISPTTYTDPKGNYVWTKAPTATHTLPTTNFSNTKNVLFVDGNLNITGNITLDDGVGFFAVFVSGNITVDPSVTNLEGIYLADGTFSTGIGATQLNVRGSVASYTGFTASNLQRDLASDQLPAEIFTFAPDQIALFPEKLGYRRTRWTEVAP